MDVSKRGKTSWTKFHKKPWPKKKKKGGYLFNERRRKELENIAYPSEFMAATMFFGSRSVDWMFGSLEVVALFFSFTDQCLFSLLFFQKLFSLFSHDLNRLFLYRLSLYEVEIPRRLNQYK